MSFEIYLNCFGATEQSGLPRDAVRSLFPLEERASQPDYWLVRYGPKDWCHIGVKPLKRDRERLHSLYVERPCGDPRLWDAFYEVLKMGEVVLFFPGGPLIVAKKNSGANLPEEMVEGMREPVSVESGEAIVKIVREC